MQNMKNPDANTSELKNEPTREDAYRFIEAKTGSDFFKSSASATRNNADSIADASINGTNIVATGLGSPQVAGLINLPGTRKCTVEGINATADSLENNAEYVASKIEEVTKSLSRK